MHYIAYTACTSEQTLECTVVHCINLQLSIELRLPVSKHLGVPSMVDKVVCFMKGLSKLPLTVSYPVLQVGVGILKTLVCHPWLSQFTECLQVSHRYLFSIDELGVFQEVVIQSRKRLLHCLLTLIH